MGKKETNSIDTSRYLKFNYKIAKQSESVVVLYAGPSAKSNSPKIINYIKENNSIVIGANYNYESIGIKSDYTYVANDFKLVEQKDNFKNDIIVPRRIFSGEYEPKISQKILKKHISRGFNVFMVGEHGDKTTYSSEGVLKINKDGSLPYGRLSSAGHGCMLLATVCRPKRILFVGLDGPSDKTCAEKIMFDGRIQKYGKPQKNENFKQHFIDVILPTIFNCGIEVETFSDVGVYGLDKKSLKIREI